MRRACAAPQVEVRTAALSQRKVEGVEGRLSRGSRRECGVEMQADVRMCAPCAAMSRQAGMVGCGWLPTNLRSPFACAPAGEVGLSEQLDERRRQLLRGSACQRAMQLLRCA